MLVYAVLWEGEASLHSAKSALCTKIIVVYRPQFDATVCFMFQINYWIMGEQNETMALFRIIRNQTDHGMIIALREDTDYFINVQVLNSGNNLGPKSETYPVRTLRAGTPWLCCCNGLVSVNTLASDMLL